MRTVRCSAAAAIVEFLKAQWIERDGRRHRLIAAVGGIFGHGNVAGLGQALAERGGDALPFFQPKNEQGMVHTAIAWTKERNRLGALACTSSVGPGATNMVTGAATATINRLPVLLLPGDVFASRLPAPVLQQLEHRASMDTSVNDCFRPVSRYWDRIQRPEQLLRALPEAMRVLASPIETGAVTICLPQDVQAEAADFPASFFEERTVPVPRPAPDDRALREATEAVRGARRPFLIAGGGVRYSEAGGALLRFVEGTGIPVGVTQAGKGTISDDHALCAGAVGATGTLAANELAREADLVLLAGTRLSDFTTASKTLFREDATFVGVQIDPYDAGKHGALPVVGDARVVLDRLADALGDHRVPGEWTKAINGARARWDEERRRILQGNGRNGRLTQAEVIRILNENVGAQATIVHAAGGLPGDLHKLWVSRSSFGYHSEYGYSCMGYEIAGALGVKMAAPEREVYALVGDGSYLMLHSELVTSLQEGRKITVVLIDNGGYQCIHGLQKQCGGRSFGNEFRRRNGRGVLAGELVAIDYAASAAGLGAATYRAESEDELVRALTSARAETRSSLIHVTVDLGPPVPSWAWWDVPTAEASDADGVREARARYLEARADQRYYY